MKFTATITTIFVCVQISFAQCPVDWDQSWYFDSTEFDCTCGASAKCVMNETLVRRLNVAREICGCAFYVSSGYRTPDHNIAVNGAVKSSHVDGSGVDLKTFHDDQYRFKILVCLLRAGFKRIGIYPAHIHVDVGNHGRDSVIWMSR